MLGAISWSQEALLNAARAWVKLSLRFAPGFAGPPPFLAPTRRLVEDAFGLVNRLLTSQQEFIQALLAAGKTGDGREPARDLEAAGVGANEPEGRAAATEAAQDHALEALRQAHRAQKEALAKQKAAMQGRATAEAERDKALGETRAAQAAAGEAQAAAAEARQSLAELERREAEARKRLESEKAKVKQAAKARRELQRALEAAEQARRAAAEAARPPRTGAPVPARERGRRLAESTAAAAPDARGPQAQAVSPSGPSADSP